MRWPSTRRRAVCPSRILVVERLEDRSLLSTVTNLSDHDPGSLRDAIASTDPGGTVDFQDGLSGTILLTEGQLDITKNLTIRGPGPDVIEVDGNSTTQVFHIFNPEQSPLSVAISGLTITHGVAGFGGGIGLSTTGTGNRLSVSGCVFRGNSAPSGIGGSGGAIQASSDNTLTVSNSLFVGNTARFGGAIQMNSRATLTVTNSTFSENSADDDDQASFGGGIQLNSDSTLTIANSTFSGNYGTNGGGVQINGSSTLTITRSTFSGNSAGIGGGIQMNSDGTLTITNSTFSGNIAATGAGIQMYSNGTLTITSSTLSGNTAPGGGIQMFSGTTLRIRNTIVAGSTVVGGSIDSRGHNLISEDSDPSRWSFSDMVGTSDAPIDPLLGPLQDNGGPTRTMALLAGSPAIDAGDNTNAPEWDQRGPGFDRIVNGIIDIGAFELQAAAAPSRASRATELSVPASGPRTTLESTPLQLVLQSTPVNSVLAHQRSPKNIVLETIAPRAAEMVFALHQSNPPPAQQLDFNCDVLAPSLVSQC